jgi:small subunit ribosomal protein S16
MLKIRLQRVGRKNHAEFRVVVSEHQKTPTSGKNLEILGSYNPHTDTVTLVKDRIEYWMSVGAKPSGTVHNMLINQQVIKGKKVNVLPKKTAPQKEEAPATPAA